ncbi:hypothetical protein OG21DRAFT_1516742 [Imleria badia]|nr:hypothetical protein OG21DRAFT_1516742 [Imleria badia]
MHYRDGPDNVLRWWSQRPNLKVQSVPVVRLRQGPRFFMRLVGKKNSAQRRRRECDSEWITMIETVRRLNL